MSILDAFFSRGFKAPKCKTLLKLTIPRIKLLRNRREVQIKQMRKDIAKLLETGQEASARIRVEHIIREQNMMAAQEIIELFCELISVRLPIIEAQRECPLDLKEAISSVCFAAPRCADLTELLQVQMLFAAKYGKEFVDSATELVPNCGVNRQLIEFLSVRAPAPDVKLKLLKEIAVEHEFDWDPAASETEFLKPHEDLLNGSTQFVTGSQLPLPKEKHDESVNSIQIQEADKQSDSDTIFDMLDFPEVPKVELGRSPNSGKSSEIPHFSTTPHPKVNNEQSKHSEFNENVSPELSLEPDEPAQDKSNFSVNITENKQFIPFINPPPLSSPTISEKHDDPPVKILRTKAEVGIDLQDVLAAAKIAAESAECSAAAARSAASLAEVRINEILNKQNCHVTDDISENPFSAVDVQSWRVGRQDFKSEPKDSNALNHYSDDMSDIQSDFGIHSHRVAEYESAQPNRLHSIEVDSYFSYPNLFSSQNSNLESGAHSVTDQPKCTFDP